MYKVSTQAPHERLEIIAEAEKNSKESYPFYEYQNTRTDLPIIRIDSGLPIYRMANYRTRVAQLKYIHDQKCTDDFFSAGQENDSAQQAQHEILTVFAKRGKGESSISPIMTELESESQRDPLLITSSGVVVNGNRRLAAIRELFTDRPGEFKHFSHVDCAVLPSNVTAEEIREIEVRLQMRPETRLPYGWIDQAIAIREMYEAQKSDDYISELLKKKPKECQRSARALTEVDIYLKEWVHEAGEYQLVEDAEQFFNDLAKALENIEGEALEIRRRIAWTLLSSPSMLSRRLYDYNFSFDKKTNDVISSLADRLSIDLTPAEPDNDEDDDIEINVPTGGEDDDFSLEALIEAFDDPDQREQIAEDLVEVCDSIWDQTRQTAVGKQALNAIQAANSKLLGVDISKADPSTFGAIQAQLETSKATVEKLEDTLQPYLSGNSDGQ